MCALHANTQTIDLVLLHVQAILKFNSELKTQVTRALFQNRGFLFLIKYFKPQYQNLQAKHSNISQLQFVILLM